MYKSITVRVLLFILGIEIMIAGRVWMSHTDRETLLPLAVMFIGIIVAAFGWAPDHPTRWSRRFRKFS